MSFVGDIKADVLTDIGAIQYRNKLNAMLEGSMRIEIENAVSKFFERKIDATSKDEYKTKMIKLSNLDENIMRDVARKVTEKVIEKMKEITIDFRKANMKKEDLKKCAEIREAARKALDESLSKITNDPNEIQMRREVFKSELEGSFQPNGTPWDRRTKENAASGRAVSYELLDCILEAAKKQYDKNKEESKNPHNMEVPSNKGTSNNADKIDELDPRDPRNQSDPRNG